MSVTDGGFDSAVLDQVGPRRDRGRYSGDVVDEPFPLSVFALYRRL